jgi:hypothetical protein
MGIEKGRSFADLIDKSIMDEWNFDKNTISPLEISKNYKKPVWWRCSFEHEWMSSPCTRFTNKVTCKACTRHAKNSVDGFISIASEQLLKQWDYSKNKLLPNQVSKATNFKFWWVCDHGHSFEQSISARVGQGQGCPFCSNKKANKDNNLLSKFPDLCAEWDYEKNKKRPDEFLPGSRARVWWKCINGHGWQAWITDRANLKTGGTKCTQCNYGYILRDRGSIDIDNKRECKNCLVYFDLNENNFRIRKSNKTENKFHFDNMCKSCSSIGIENYRKTDAGVSADIVRRAKSVSKIKNLKFDLTKKWVLNRLSAIEWKCELTGINFNREEKKMHQFNWDSLSIDKIDPNGGYVQNNVRFILNIINTFKSNGSDERMYFLAKSLIDFKVKNE